MPDDPRREGPGGRSGRTTAGSTGGASSQDSPEREAPRTTPGREARTSGSGSGTEGTNRDFDETGESKNEGHGHPREERGTSD